MRNSRLATRDDTVAQFAAALIERLRLRSPHVHCITNAVAQNFTANVLLAVGCVPSMTLSAEEIGGFVSRADALLVNLGTFDRERREATDDRGRNRRARETCLGCSIRYSSTAAPRARLLPGRLLARAPKAVRLNAAEFTALVRQRADARARWRPMRAQRKCVIGLSGATDLVGDGERLAVIANGHPLMAKVTAMGCAVSALVAACLGVEQDAWLATVAALTIAGVAGELAAEKAAGPGSFAVAFLDALFNLDGSALVANARINFAKVN